MSEVGIDTLKRWRIRPSVMVRELFGVIPDAWQVDVLDAFPSKEKIAMVACKGPGKTTVLSWLCWNFLLCYPAPLKVLATSITSDNLSDGLWAEMAKWQAKSEILQREFEWLATEIRSRETRTKFMSARAWPRSGNAQQQADTLAGFHEDRVMAVLDESGGIPVPVLATAEAVLANTGPGKIGHIVQAGNPTQMDGCLYESAVKHRSHWHVIEITADPDSPLRTPRVSVEWAREQIQKYGADNPWVMVNVFGKFPPSGLQTLLSPDEVQTAMKRHHSEDQVAYAARILGVDVARFGDDATVVFPRQGMIAFPPHQMRNATTTNIAGYTGNKYKQWDADAIMVDGTGGYGAGVIDQLNDLKYPVTEVQFAGKPIDPKFGNKRAEMWWLMCEWVRERGALPNVPELLAELTVPMYFFRGDKIFIEDKDQVKARLGRSPDFADALGLTFAMPVERRDPHAALRQQRSASYDPLELAGGFHGSAPADYDPLTQMLR